MSDSAELLPGASQYNEWHKRTAGYQDFDTGTLDGQAFDEGGGLVASAPKATEGIKCDCGAVLKDDELYARICWNCVHSKKYPEKMRAEKEPKTYAEKIAPIVSEFVKEESRQKECMEVAAKEFIASRPGMFITRDSGNRSQFETGAQRDCAEGKGRYDLIPPLPMKRLAQLYERGAIKYGDRNWQKGIPLYRFLDSAERHLYDYKSGDRVEDHLTAVIWNVMGYIHTEAEIKAGRLPASLAGE